MCVSADGRHRARATAAGVPGANRGRAADGPTQVAGADRLRYAVRFGTNGSVVRALLAARNEGKAIGAIDACTEDLPAVDLAALAADCARCAAAPVLAVVGDEALVRPAIAAGRR